MRNIKNPEACDLLEYPQIESENWDSQKSLEDSMNWSIQHYPREADFVDLLENFQL